MPIQPSQKQIASGLQTGIGRFFQSRKLRWCLVGFGGLILLLALFYAEENARGKRAWTSYQRQLTVRGVEFNWHALTPPVVADDENFAATPFFAALFDFVPGTHTPRDTVAYNRTAGFAQTGEPFVEQRRGNDPIPAFYERHRTDLAGGLRQLQKAKEPSNKAGQDGDRPSLASSVLEMVAKFNPVLDELREPSRRPHTRFNLSYDEENTWRMPQPHLAVLKRVCMVLTLRASAELALRDNTAAAEDVRLIIALANSVRDEPFQSSYWMRVALLVNARQIIWEGLADHHWSDNELKDFQLWFGQLTLVNDARRPVGLERASIDQLFGQLHLQPDMVKGWGFGPGAWNKTLPYFLWLMPSGWMYREQISYHRAYEERLLPALDASGGRIRPGLIHKSGQSGSPIWTHRLLADVFLQSVDGMLRGAALAQNGRDQTLVACGLERYRLANGAFPDHLDLLQPQFIGNIPADVISGQPLKYRLTDNGRFLLYSVGWNEKDDDGNVVKNKDGQGMDVTQGDWVWPQYPDQ